MTASLEERKREARQATCTTGRLSELRRDRSPAVRRLVARHRNTSGTDVRYLLDDPDEWVRFHLAGRLDLTEHARWKLASDPAMRVRKNLAQLQDDPALLMALSADAHPSVRDTARYECWLRVFADVRWTEDKNAEQALVKWICAVPCVEMRRRAARTLARVRPWYYGYRDSDLDFARKLARDSDSVVATCALGMIIRRGTEDEVLSICTDHSLAPRISDAHWAWLRRHAAFMHMGPTVLRLLARDHVPQVAAAALANWDGPSVARWRILRRDRYLRRVVKVMVGRRWRMWLALDDLDVHRRGLRRTLSEIGDALLIKRLLYWPGDDCFLERACQAEEVWTGYCRPARQPLLDVVRSQRYCRELLAHPYLRRRHPWADPIARNLTVRYDRRMRNVGEAHVSATTIRLNPLSAMQEVLAHELAHLLTESNPYFRGSAPVLGAHGGAFAATMLDVVRVAYGHRARWRLRWQYFQHGVPVIASARRIGRRRSMNDTHGSE